MSKRFTSRLMDLTTADTMFQASPLRSLDGMRTLMTNITSWGGVGALFAQILKGAITLERTHIQLETEKFLRFFGRSFGFFNHPFGAPTPYISIRWLQDLRPQVKV